MKHLLTISALALLFVGCAPQQPVYRPVPAPKPKPEPKPAVTPVKPTNVHELKEVQDDNFDPEYMYPETPKKKYKEPVSKKPVDTTTPVVSTSQMSREECIGMIGEAKFDKYTQMLGSENAAIKRCILMKSMQ